MSRARLGGLGPLLLGLAASGALALAGCGTDARDSEPASAEPPMPSKPSASRGGPPRIVILVSIDTLRADHLGVYGYERPTSPFLELMAQEGVVFEDASAPSPFTLPSHASMFTGLFPRGHRVMTAGKLPPELPTLASLLAKRGYHTAAVVNSHWLRQENYGVTRDFDDYLWVEEDEGRRAPSTWVTDQALEWLRRVGDGRLFLFVHYFDVHADYASEPRWEELFVTPYDGEIDGTAQQLHISEAQGAEGLLAWCEETFGGGEACERARERAKEGAALEFDDAAVTYLRQLYDAGVRQMDAELGRFFRELRRMDVYDEALLIVTSDHGEEFMEHGRVSHFYTTYQEVLHVPLIVRGPGVPQGLRVEAPVSIVDIVPTILALVGARPPETVDGFDLSPLWQDGDAGPLLDRDLFGEGTGGTIFGGAARGIPEYTSVRRGRYKLVHEAASDRSALYDLGSDPGEQADVSAEEPGIAALLAAKLRARHEGQEPGSGVEIAPEDLERLRALGYAP